MKGEPKKDPREGKQGQAGLVARRQEPYSNPVGFTVPVERGNRSQWNPQSCPFLVRPPQKDHHSL